MTSRRARFHTACSILAASLLLSACTIAPRTSVTTTAPAQQQQWSGRMAVQVNDSASLRPDAQQSCSAAFELQGTAAAGSLQLFTPLGSSVARITWQPGTAMIEQSGQQRTSDSLETLVRETLGTDIPVQALFAWLQGQQQDVPGWQVDISRHADGRISAVRHEPQPQAQLRVVLDQ